MTRLSAGALPPFLRFLEALAACSNLATFPTQLLAALRELIPCDIASYNRLLPGCTEISWMADPDDRSLLRYGPIFEQYAEENPLIIYARQTGGGQSHTISDFLAQRDFQRLGLYAEFFRPLSPTDQLAVALASPHGEIIGLALSRGGRGFGDDDRILLDLSLPYIVQTLRTAGTMTLLRQGLAASGYEPVIVDHAGRICEASVQAWQWLTSYFGPAPPDAPWLPPPLQRWVQLQRAARQVASLVPLTSTPFTLIRGDLYLVVQLVANGSAADRDLLLLSEHAVRPTPPLLMQLGLSQREADVLAWVAAGLSNATIATQLGLSERTIETHTKHILAKLGVPSQAAAVARAWQLLGHLPAPDLVAGP